MQAKMLCVRLCMWIPVRIVRLFEAELVASQRWGRERRGATGTARTRGLPGWVRPSLCSQQQWVSALPRDAGCGMEMRGEAREDELVPSILWRKAEHTCRQAVPWGNSQRGCCLVLTLDTRLLTELVWNLCRGNLQSRTLWRWQKSKPTSGLALWSEVSVEVPLQLPSKDNGGQAGRRFPRELAAP